MRYAIIDIGSNTMKLNVYLAKEKSIDMLFHKKAITSLASYINEGVMSEQGIDVIVSQILDFDATLKKLDISNVFVIATAAIRGAKNNVEILQTVKDKTGIDIELIASDFEAILGYQGLPEVLRYEGGINVDVGGGSSEILVHSNNEIISSQSMPIGCLSLYSEYVSMIFPNKEEENKIEHRAVEELNRLFLDESYKSYGKVTAIGGTARAAIKLLNAVFPKEKKDVIFKKEIDQVLEILTSKEDEKKSVLIKTLVRVIPERIHTIAIGLIIYKMICERLEIEEMQISTSGIMDGYLHYKLFAQ